MTEGGGAAAGWSAWARAACGDLYGEIFTLPFLRSLADGSLPDYVFARYLRQDALYLPAYARSMRRLAERLPEGEERDLFGHFADDGVAAEQAMQAEFGLGAYDGPTAACLRSIAHAGRMAEEQDLAVALAGVLPCFAVYAELGSRLVAGLGGEVPSDHPYGHWIAMYAGHAFARDAAAAAAVCDSYARRFPDRWGKMLDAYREGVELERDFWNVAWKGRG